MTFHCTDVQLLLI